MHDGSVLSATLAVGPAKRHVSGRSGRLAGRRTVRSRPRAVRVLVGAPQEQEIDDPEAALAALLLREPPHPQRVEPPLRPPESIMTGRTGGPRTALRVA